MASTQSDSANGTDVYSVTCELRVEYSSVLLLWLLYSLYI
jgi:hypothetical protein